MIKARIYGVAAVAAFTFAVVQTVRIEGPWILHGYKEEVADLTRQITENNAASDANAAAAVVQVKTVETKSVYMAKGSDNDHATYVSEARTAASAFANANRRYVRTNPDGLGTPAAPTSRDDPVIPDEVPAEALVAYRERDLQTDADLYAYALAAHNHAMDRIEAGLAKPPVDWPEPDFTTASPSQP